MLIAQTLAAALALTAPAQTLATSARGLPFPEGHTQTINIIEWDAEALPKIYERSAQLPLTEAELTKLAGAGFTTAQLVKMLEERRCACDASADGLIRMKEAGVPQEVLSAVSLHALQPNRELFLDVTLDFTGEGNQAREAYLYAFVNDGDLTRVLSLNVADLLARKNAHDAMVDQSDILLTRKVRRIRLVGDIPLKTYGPHTILVATSGSPTLTHPSQLTERERKNAQTYTFEYPRSSLQSVCRLNAGYKRDPVLAYKWRFMGSRFECEWN